MNHFAHIAFVHTGDFPPEFFLHKYVKLPMWSSELLRKVSPEGNFSGCLGLIFRSKSGTYAAIIYENYAVMERKIYPAFREFSDMDKLPKELEFKIFDTLYKSPLPVPFETIRAVIDEFYHKKHEESDSLLEGWIY